MFLLLHSQSDHLCNARAKCPASFRPGEIKIPAGDILGRELYQWGSPVKSLASPVIVKIRKWYIHSPAKSQSGHLVRMLWTYFITAFACVALFFYKKDIFKRHAFQLSDHKISSEENLVSREVPSYRALPQSFLSLIYNRDPLIPWHAKLKLPQVPPSPPGYWVRI